MPRLPQGLVYRGPVIYFRKRVPKGLIPFIEGNVEAVSYSLKTTDPKEANRKLPGALLDYQQKIDAAELRLRQSETSKPISLSDEEIKSLALRWFISHERQLDAKYRNISSENAEQAIDGLRGDLEAVGLERSNSVDAPHKHTDEAVDALLDEYKIKFDRSSDEYHRLREWVSLGLFESYGRKLADIDNSFKQPIVYHGFSGVDHLSPLPDKSKLVSTSKQFTVIELLELYLSDRKMRKASEAKYRRAMTLLSDFVGKERPVRNIEFQDFLSFREFLESKQSLKRVSINNQFEVLGSIFRFAHEKDIVAKDWASGLKFKLSKEEADEGRYDLYTVEELSVIFSAPLYTGCIDDGWNCFKVGPNRPKRERFWIPLIALFTGMRLSEICQLHTEDVVLDVETPHIVVSALGGGVIAKDKHIKNDYSSRKVPIHQELLRIGLDAYAYENAAEGNKRLFPRLPYNERHENYSANFSKWYVRFLKELKLKENTKRLTFHSFRHTWAQAARDSDVHEEFYQKIGGWSPGGQRWGDSVSRRYGNLSDVRLLNDKMQKIRFKGLDLSHLYVE